MGNGSMKPTCLALDLGTTMGWAVHCHDIYTAGSIRLQKSAKELWGKRFIEFRRQLLEMVRVEKPTRVFYERVRRHMSTDSAHVYGGFMAITHAICCENDLPLIGLDVGTIKKYATGNGAAKKPAMIEAAKKLWPDIEIDVDDTADALHILRLGLTIL